MIFNDHAWKRQMQIPANRAHRTTAQRNAKAINLSLPWFPSYAMRDSSKKKLRDANKAGATRDAMQARPGRPGSCSVTKKNEKQGMDGHAIETMG
jgi:hypothetical protein